MESNVNYNLDRVILHCDVNNFYASVECASKKELKGKPVAVSGNPKTRTGIILAKTEVLSVTFLVELSSIVSKSNVI